MRSATSGSRQNRTAPMAWHRGVVLSRHDPVFSPKQAPVTYNTVRDHRAPEQQRKNQQKIQTAATGWAGCARRGQLEHGRSARGRPWQAHDASAAAAQATAAAAAAALLEAAAEHSWTGAAGGACSDDRSVRTALDLWWRLSSYHSLGCMADNTEEVQRATATRP